MTYPDPKDWDCWSNGVIQPLGVSMIIEATIQEIQSSFDWAEVFGEGSGHCTQDVDSHDGTPTDTVLRKDIAEVLASVNGQNDGDSWIVVCRLVDGRFCCAEGSCDYTGWDCQAWNTITVASSLGALIESGITPEWCRRLGIEHPSQSI